MKFIRRDYKECIKDFIRGVGLNLGDPEDFNTARETSWVRYLLYDIPAYVDMFLKGRTGGGHLIDLITSKTVFTLRALVGLVEVLIEYNLEGRDEVYGCTFTNKATNATLFLQVVNGSLHMVDSDSSLADLSRAETTKAIQSKMYEIFD